MRLSQNVMYPTKVEAQEEIKDFRKEHPKSAKRFGIREEIVFFIYEI